jgi:hypothetical protein
LAGTGTLLAELAFPSWGLLYIRRVANKMMKLIYITQFATDFRFCSNLVQKADVAFQQSAEKSLGDCKDIRSTKRLKDGTSSPSAISMKNSLRVRLILMFPAADLVKQAPSKEKK